MITQHRPSRSFSRFTPKTLVSQAVRKNFLSLYPKQMIGETWSDVEINLALNVNKTTLRNADISENIIIDTLVDQFGATTQIQVSELLICGKISNSRPNVSQCDVISQ